MLECGIIKENKTKAEIDYIERVIEEIIASELLYRNSLYKILVNYKPVINGSRKLATSSLSILFDILEDICCLTSDFLISLKNSKSNLRTFTESFILRERQILCLYSDYCSTLSSATDVLSKLSNKDKLWMTLRHVQTEGCHELPLNAELLKPFQHLFAYEILLEKLYKVTCCKLLKKKEANTINKQNTCTLIKVALGRIRMILEEINELKRTKENRARLKELLNGGLKIFGDFHLDQQGELLFEGTVSQINKSVSRHLILLEKCLLVCKKYFSFLVVKHILITDKILIEDEFKDEKDTKVFTIFEIDLNQRFEFSSCSAEQKRLWLKHLKTATNQRRYHTQCTMYNGYIIHPNTLNNHVLTSSLQDNSIVNSAFTSTINSPFQSKLSLYKPKYSPRRSNSVTHHIKAVRKSTNEMGSAPELSEDEQQRQLCVRTEWVLPPKYIDNGDRSLKSRKKSLLRVYSFRKYNNVSLSKNSGLNPGSIRATTLNDLKGVNCIQTASA